MSVRSNEPSNAILRAWGQAARVLGYRREDRALYVTIFFASLGGLALIYAVVFLDSWFRERSMFDLKVGVCAGALAVLCGVIPKNRREIFAGETGIVMALGTVGTVVNRRPEGIPVVIVAAAVLWILTRKRAGRVRRGSENE
jgi:hypothetical protein